MQVYALRCFAAPDALFAALHTAFDRATGNDDTTENRIPWLGYHNMRGYEVFSCKISLPVFCSHAAFAGYLAEAIAHARYGFPPGTQVIGCKRRPGILLIGRREALGIFRDVAAVSPATNNPPVPELSP